MMMKWCQASAVRVGQIETAAAHHGGGRRAWGDGRWAAGVAAAKLPKGAKIVRVTVMAELPE